MTALLRLYPRSWRDRYEEEFLGLLEVRPPTMRDRVDIVRGALDAQLDNGAPDRWARPVWVAAVSAIVAGSLWIAWLLLSMHAFHAVEEDPVMGVGRLVSMFAGLAALAGHVSLGFASMDRMRGWGGAAAGIAAVGFLISAFGGGAAALLALGGSIGLATAVAGRTVPMILAVAWMAAVVGVFAAFAALVRTQWTDPSVLNQGLPFGIVWILIGVTVAVRGIPPLRVDAPRPEPEG
jgi:hypothetical protein